MVCSVVWLHILLGPYWCVCVRVCGALFGMKIHDTTVKKKEEEKSGEVIHCIELNIFHPEVLSKVVLGYYM